MKATLYWIPASHPANAARLALEHKGVEIEFKDLLAGLHVPMLRAAGFKSHTVPAVKFDDGTKVQGSLAVMQELERRAPQRPLYPADPDRRVAVEQAELWGEQALQPVPRRIVRLALQRDGELRAFFAEAQGMPVPAVAGAAFLPVVMLLARDVGADEGQVREDLQDVPRLLDLVDALLAEGTIGGDEPNAADFQIGPSVRLLGALGETAALVAGRPCDAHAKRLMPEYGQFPRGLPEEWSPAPAGTG